MVDGDSRGIGEIRAALEDVIRSRCHLDAIVAELGYLTRTRLQRTADAVAPGAGRAAAQAIRPPQVVTELIIHTFEPTAAELDRAAHQLLDLLSVRRGLPALTPFTPATTGNLGRAHDASRFGEAASSYLSDVVADVAQSRSMSKDSAAQVPLVGPAVAAAALDAVVSGTSPANRDRARAMLTDPACHAVQAHGPHIGEDAQLARLIWAKDFTGIVPWRVRPEDGRVKSKLNSSTVAGGFTSARAMAAPLDAFLTVVDTDAPEFAEALDDHGPGGSVGVFVDAWRAGLGPGDARLYRGTATRSHDGAADWYKARAHSMMAEGRCGPPVRAVDHDPILHGPEPGTRLIFRRRGGRWTLATYFPVSAPEPGDLRPEDFK